MTKSISSGPRTKALAMLARKQRGSIDGNLSLLSEREFIIWFTARSGSTWLGSLLFSAGFPKPSEYFHPNKVVRMASYLGVTSWADYVGSIKQKRTRRGLFGHEMTFQFWDMLRNDGDIMSHLDFSGPSVVLFREDIVLQAVSIYIAIASNKWHRYEGTGQRQHIQPILYDETKIRERVQYICNLELGLKQHQNLLIPAAKFMSYEQLSSSAIRTVIGAFERHIGFKALAIEHVHSSHVPVRTKINQEMRDRFLRENEQFVTAIQEKRSWLFACKKQFPMIDTC